MAKSAEVERWFATTKPPSEAALRRVRDLILAADRRMTEYVKYGTIQFAFEGDFAGFVQVKKTGVNLMLMRGGLLQGKYPHVEGTGRAVRFMRFADVKEANARASELKAVVRDWCTVRSASAKK